MSFDFAQVSMDERFPSRLVLGTAQLGMPYGVANQCGMPDEDTVNAIIDEAFASGIRIIDTAQHYGESENRLGRYLARNPEKPFHVISKLHPGLDPGDQAGLIESVRKSHEVIGRTLAAMMIHNMKWLDSGLSTAVEALHRCMQQGYLKTFGISVYSFSEFERSLDIEGLQLIQIPLNVLDRRFLTSDLLTEAGNRGITIFVRSVYLQGLLAMPEQEAVGKVPGAAFPLSQWHHLCRAGKYDPLDVALSYVLQSLPRAFVLVGCELPRQVKENRSRESFALPESVKEEINAWQVPPETVINPTYWR